MTLSIVELYTDGSALRNPGMGGYAYIIRYTVDDPANPTVPLFKDIEKNQGYRYTTNNRMELMGAIFGIRGFVEAVKDGTITGCSQLNIFSDSEYLCKSINNRWINKWMENNWMTSGFGGKSPQPIKNKDLWEDLIKAQDELRSIGVTFSFSHVTAHVRDGDEKNQYNNKVDKLAVAASSGTNHIIDEVFEQTTLFQPKKSY